MKRDEWIGLGLIGLWVSAVVVWAALILRDQRACESVGGVYSHQQCWAKSNFIEVAK